MKYKQCILTHDGRTMNASQWARDYEVKKLGLIAPTIRWRKNVEKMTDEESLTTPKRRHGPRKKNKHRLRPTWHTCVNESCQRAFKSTGTAEHGLCPQCWKKDHYQETTEKQRDFTKDFEKRFKSMCEAFGV